MSTIRVVRGSGTGPTAIASYDAALADAGVHDYNLVTVSSVVPADADLAVVETVPDLGPVGDRLTVVQSRRTVGPDAPEPGVVGLGWVRSADGPGIFYEASGAGEESVREEIRAGLERGVSLRDWNPAEEEVVVRTVEVAPDEHATAVALAIYGESEPIL